MQIDSSEAAGSTTASAISGITVASANVEVPMKWRIGSPPRDSRVVPSGRKPRFCCSRIARQRFVRVRPAVDALAALGREQRDDVIARTHARRRPRRSPRRCRRPRGRAPSARSPTGRRRSPCTCPCGRRRTPRAGPSTSPGPGSARSTSCTTRGFPNSSRTAARIRMPPDATTRGVAIRPSCSHSE